jgi:hypothetical protein
MVPAHHLRGFGEGWAASQEFLNGDIAQVWLEAFGYEHCMELMGLGAGAFAVFLHAFLRLVFQVYCIERINDPKIVSNKRYPLRHLVHPCQYHPYQKIHVHLADQCIDNGAPRPFRNASPHHPEAKSNLVQPLPSRVSSPKCKCHFRSYLPILCDVRRLY